MHEFLVENKAWNGALTGTGDFGPRPPGILRRIGNSVPPVLVPIARRGLSNVSAHLPVALRSELHRLARLMRPAEIDVIERDYPGWVALCDRMDAATRRGIMSKISQMANRPLISIIMPVFNPLPAHLTAALASVRGQFYPRWELCVGDDASTNPLVTRILRQAAEQDHRIKLVRRERNGHIPAASNSALRLATGLFVALVDHDDVLAPSALFEVAARIIEQPDVDVIYSDEDHIDGQGSRSNPYFKPDWNADLMLGQNLVSHLGVYRRRLVEKVGGFRAGFEGSQDHDLALRVIAETRADRIAHIPKVLYHWRQGSSDHTFSQAQQQRCTLNSRRAIHEIVLRDEPNAKVVPLPVVSTWTRVVYPVPEPMPLVSVVVSGGTSHRLVDRLLNGSGYPALEILAQAGDATLPSQLAEGPSVRIVAGRSASGLAQEARGHLLLLLDADLEAREPGWLREMVSHALRPDVGAVGAKLLDHDGTVRHAGFALGGQAVAFEPFTGLPGAQAGYFGHLQLTRDVTAVSRQCLMVRRRDFLAAGGLDEDMSVPGFSEIDLCLKLSEAGQRTVWTPHAQLYFRHRPPGLPADAAGWQQEAVRLRQRWGRKLDSDPFWSRNFAPGPGGPRLAFPPLAEPEREYSQPALRRA